MGKERLSEENIVGEKTNIEWCSATYNPWRGCHKVSPACAHCYMFREQTRYGNDPNVVVRASNATFYAPLKWREPKKIFTCSWSDFFIEEADPWRDDAWRVIQKTPQHTYQILTKRPERIRANLWAMANVWLGVSVENKRFYGRIEELQKAPVDLRFLSIEPLLGPMPDLPLDGIGWVIVGGESGPNWRPLNVEWVRQIRDRCVERGVPFFFKQWSGLHPKGLGRLLDGRTWNEFPAV
jgi:protein gp37